MLYAKGNVSYLLDTLNCQQNSVLNENIIKKKKYMYI
jgi:hypothetical protein